MADLTAPFFAVINIFIVLEVLPIKVIWYL